MRDLLLNRHNCGGCGCVSHSFSTSTLLHPSQSLNFPYFHLHPHFCSHFPSLTLIFLLLLSFSITPSISLICFFCSFLSSVLSIRLSSTASGSDVLFGPPLESAFKSKSFDGREQLREQSAFGASECKRSSYFKTYFVNLFNI